MESQRAWKIMGDNLDKLVPVMLSVQKGSSVSVFCDQKGENLAIANPSGVASIKLCSVTGPDLEGSYGLRSSGSGFVNDDGEEISREQLASYLVQYIIGARDGGAEWGWEFKLA